MERGDEIVNVIDRRAIELEFDNSKFEKNARSTIKALDELDEKLEMKGATDGLEKIEKIGNHFSLRNIENGVSRIADSFTLLGRTVLKVKDVIADSMAGMVFKVKNYADEYVGLLTTMNQAGAGFAKYSKYTTSVRTIQSALPDTDLKTITDALDDLNKYTDETSYDFTEMVASIGKFTANGVKLKDAVEAMKGIGNEAAKSGAGIQEANRAMYNFAQALATGSVKLIDWKSIENANMATKEFKEQIIETAVELGTLKKQGDKVLTKKGTVVDFAKFSSTLNEAWFTSDVLTKVLGKYADTTTKFGLDAFHAAQEAKTFAEAIDAVKDAASSGWRKTWELVFGNIEEATKLFTGLANKLIEITDTVSEWRNEILQGWKDLGGREDLIQGLSDSFDALLLVVEALGDGIKMVFPEITAENVKTLTDRVSEFGKTLKGLFVTESVFEEGKDFAAEMESLFGDFDGTLKKGIKSSDVKELQTRLKELGYDLGDAGVDGIFGPKTEEAVKKFQEDMHLTVTGIFDEDDRMALAQRILGFEQTFDSIEKKTPLFERFQNIFGGIAAAARVFGRVLSFVWGVITRVASVLSPVTNMFGKIADAVGRLFMAFDRRMESSELFASWLDKLSAKLEPVRKKIDEVCQSILAFLGIEGDLNDIDFDEVVDNIVKKVNEAWTTVRNWIRGVFGLGEVDEKGNLITGALGLSADNVDKTLDDVLASLKEKISKFISDFKEMVSKLFVQEKNDGVQGDKKYVDFLNIFSVLFVGAAAVFGFELFRAVSNIAKFAKNAKKLAKNLNEIIESFGNGKFFKRGGKIQRIAMIILEFAAAIAILAAAVYALSTLSWENLAKGLVGIVVLMGTFIASVVILDKILTKSKAQSLTTIGATLLSFAGAIGIMAAALWVISTIDTISLIKGLGAIAALMAICIASVVAFSKFGKQTKVNNANQFIGVILSLAGALSAMAAVVGALGGMRNDTLVKGFAALTSIVMLLAMFMKVIDGMKISGGAIGAVLAVAGSIAIVAATFVGMSLALKLMSPQDIIRGLLGLIGVIGVLSLAMAAVAMVNPSKAAVIALLPLALAITLTAGTFVVMAFAMKLLNWSDLVKSFIGLISVILILKVTLKAIENLNPSWRAVIGLLPVALALDLAIVGFAGLAFAMKRLSVGDIVKALVGLVLIVETLSIAMKTIEKVKPSIRGMLALIPAVLALDLLIVGFVFMARNMSSVSFRSLAKSLLSLITVMSSLSLFMKYASKMGIKSGVQTLISMLGLAVALAAFALALNAIKEVPADKIQTFALGLSAVFASLGVFMALTGSIGFTGVGTALVGLLGVIGVIGLVIAAFAGLAKIPGFQEFMNSGASSIGEIIGSFTGSLKAGEMKAFNSGLASFNELESPDKGKIEEAIAAAQMLADFKAGLPAVDTVTAIVEWIGNSRIEQLSEDMTSFATGFNGFVSVLDGIDNAAFTEEEGGVQSKTATMVAVATLISEFENGLTFDPTPADRIISFLLRSKLEQFTIDAQTFASGFRLFVATIKGMGDESFSDDFNVEKKTKTMVAVATLVNGFENQLTFDPTPADRIISFFLRSKMEQFVLDADNFARGFKLFAATVKATGDEAFSSDFNVEKKTKTMVAVATLINSFESQMAFDPTPADRLISFFLRSKMEQFVGDALTFASGFNTFADMMTQIDDGYFSEETNIEGKTKLAVQVATFINDFNNDITETSAADRFLNLAFGLSNMTNFTSDAAHFARGFNVFAGIMLGIDETYFSEDSNLEGKTKAAIAVANAVNEFEQSVPPRTIGERVVKIFGGSKLHLLTKDMETFATGINTFAGIMCEVKADQELIDGTGNAVTVARTISRFLEDLSGFNIERKRSALVTWLTGGTKTETILGDIGEFGRLTKDLAINFAGLSTGTFVDDADAAKQIIEKFVELLQYLSSDEVNIENNSKFLGIFGEDSNFNKMMDQFDTIGIKLQGFSEMIANFDMNQAVLAATAIRLIAEAMAVASGSDKSSAKNLTDSLAILIPWMEEFAAYGRQVDEDVATGISENSEVVSAAANALKQVILDALTLTQDDLDNVLTITPVMDLSNVDRTRKSLQKRGFSVGASAKGAAKVIGSAEAGREYAKSITNDITNTATVNVTGNTFEIKQEDDINKLANRIAALVNQQQRGFGAPIKAL